MDESIKKVTSLRDKNVVKCRRCSTSGDHWTSKCPWKNTVLGGEIPDLHRKDASASSSSTEVGKSTGTTKYGASKRPTSTSMPGKRRDDINAIRVVNLSESTTRTDLEELVKPFGPIKKLYIAKDKQTGQCKGFAYIHFKFRNDAAKAIATLNGYGCNHLILNVDWSKPPAHSN